jgi:hypothetical protein
MAKKRKHENKPQRLAEGLRAHKNHARAQLGRKNSPRARSRGNTRGTVADARPVSPIVRLIQSLGQEKIRFQIVGMSAAILQGVIVSTLDTDIWVDLPERHYIRLMNLVVKQGGTPLARTLYALSDGRLVNFLFAVHGLRNFEAEYKNAVNATIEGEPVKALPLERILKSKKTVLRDKDRVHILHIERFLKGRKRLKAAR